MADDGTQAALGGGEQALSGNGRYVAFVSASTLTTPGVAPPATPTGLPNYVVYVRDLQTGQTTQASVGDNVDTGKVEQADGPSEYPSISADGRYVSFVTTASNVTSGPGLVVCDRGAPDSSGVYRQLPAAGQPFPTWFSCVTVRDGYYENPPLPITRFRYISNPHLDGAGDRMVWQEGPWSPIGRSVYAAVVRTGGTLVANPAVSILTPPATGARAGETYFNPAISADGNWVVAQGSTDYIEVVEATLDSTGQLGATTRIDGHDRTPDPYPPNDSYTLMSAFQVSDGGRRVAFNLFTTAGPGTPFAYAPQVFTVDVASPGTPTTGSTVRLQSFRANGTVKPSAGDGSMPALSADGRFLAFTTDIAGMSAATLPTIADNAYSCIGANAPGGYATTATTPRTHCQVVVRDLTADQARRAAKQPLDPAQLASVSRDRGCSPPPGGICASNDESGADNLNGGGAPLSLDTHGGVIAFPSDASDLVFGDTNATTANSGAITDGQDVFVRTWKPTISVAVPSYGPVQIGQSVDRTVTVTVHGFGPLTFAPYITFTAPNASDFSLLGTTCQRPVDQPFYNGNTCAISIRFTPSFSGTRTSNLQLTTSSADPASTTVMSGVGTRTAPTSISPGDTNRTTVNPTGSQTNSGGGQSMISGNGRWDVFASSVDLTGRPSTNPYGGTSNIFVRDLANPQRTIQISLAGNGNDVASQPTRPGGDAKAPTGRTPNGDSTWPSISDDGRFVSFLTNASDVVPSLGAGSTLVVCDRDPNGNGIFDEVQPGTQIPDYVCYGVDYSQSEGTGLDPSVRPRLAGNGTRITWGRSTGYPSYLQQVAYADLAAPLTAPGAPVTVPIPDTAAFSGVAGGSATDPVLSQDGSRIAFTAVGGGGEGPFAIVEVDLTSGNATRMDRQPGTSGYVGDSGTAQHPAMSADGSVVAFDGGVDFSAPSVFVARRSGTAVTSVLASLNNFGRPDTGFNPALSGDGRYLAFETDVANMHNGADAPPVPSQCGNSDGQQAIPCQIVARDLVRDAQRASAGLSSAPGELVSGSIRSDCGTAPPGATCAGNADSSKPSIDLIGSEIGFDSYADDLVAGDTNNTPNGLTQDAFVRTWRPTLTAAALNFGNVQLPNSSSKTFGLSASGFGPVSISQLQTTGLNGADFRLLATTCATVLHAKATSDPAQSSTCAATVQFTPGALGARTGDIAVRAGAGTFPVIDPLAIRTMTGTGVRRPVNVPQIGVSPTSLNFGNDIPLHLPGKKKTVVVTNPGGGTLTITGVTVTDTTVPGAKNDYTVDFSDCSGGVAAGGSCTITVTFIGHAIGSRPAIVVIANNASGGPVQIGVTANVPKPRITVNPAVTPTGRVVTVSGTGFGPNTTIALSFAATVEQAEATVDAKGAFSVPLVIFPNSDQGPRTILAKTLLADPSIAATTPLLVALGTLESPTLVIRH